MFKLTEVVVYRVGSLEPDKLVLETVLEPSGYLIRWCSDLKSARFLAFAFNILDYSLSVDHLCYVPLFIVTLFRSIQSFRVFVFLKSFYFIWCRISTV